PPSRPYPPTLPLHAALPISSSDRARARRPAGAIRTPAILRAHESESAPCVARPLRHRRARVRRACERAELRDPLEGSPVAELSVGQRAPRPSESATIASVAQAIARRSRPPAPGPVVSRARRSSAIDELRTEDRPKAVVMTTSAVVLGLVAASVGRIVSLVSSIRSCLRQGRTDRP